jgi:hypothetical protein
MDATLLRGTAILGEAVHTLSPQGTRRSIAGGRDPSTGSRGFLDSSDGLNPGQIEAQTVSLHLRLFALTIGGTPELTKQLREAHPTATVVVEKSK